MWRVYARTRPALDAPDATTARGPESTGRRERLSQTAAQSVYGSVGERSADVPQARGTFDALTAAKYSLDGRSQISTTPTTARANWRKPAPKPLMMFSSDRTVSTVSTIRAQFAPRRMKNAKRTNATAQKIRVTMAQVVAPAITASATLLGSSFPPWSDWRTASRNWARCDPIVATVMMPLITLRTAPATNSQKAMFTVRGGADGATAGAPPEVPPA